MKFIIFSFLIFLLSCGNDAQPIDRHTNFDGSVHTSLPAGTPMISERYICAAGFSADKTFSSREIADIEIGFNIFNSHAQVPGLVHLTDKETNCKIVKDPNLYLPNHYLGETSFRKNSRIALGYDIVISFWDRLLLYASYYYNDVPTQDLYYGSVVAHEIFHSASMGHLPSDVPGLMNALISNLPIWSDGDQQLCQAVFICPK